MRHRSVLIDFSTNAPDVPTQCLNAIFSDIYTFACPSHGWEAVQDLIYIAFHGLDSKYLAVTEAVSMVDWVEVTGHGSQRRLSMADEYTRTEDYDLQQTVATTQQSVVADALTEAGILWDYSMANSSTTGRGSVLRRQDAVHAINSGYYQPYTMASCATDVIHGPHDDSPVAFPIPPGVETHLMLDQTKYNDSILGIHSFVYPGVTRDQILSTSGSIEETRLKWVELPQDPFNCSAIGAVILLPRSTANSKQELVVCNLGAGWGSSLINTSTFNYGVTFTTSVIKPSALLHTKIDFNQTLPTGGEATQAEQLAQDSVVFHELPFFPEKPVIVTEAWANYMNPSVPALNRTVIDILMSTNAPARKLDSVNRSTIAKLALAGLLANGLASIGATASLQGDIKTIVKSDGSRQWDGDYWFSGKGDMFIVDPEQSKDWVKLRVDTTINGYAYNMRGTSPKVAVAFLLAYCITALSHVVYAGISGKIPFHFLR